jgi:hypothetical protein
MPLTTYTAGEVLTAASLNDNFSFAASSGGLVCVKAETALSSSSTTADGVFTSEYTNYRIVIRFTTSAASLSMQLRAATVNTTANYNFQLIEANSTTVSGARSGPTSSAVIGDNTAGSFFSLAVLDLSGVQLAEPTVYNSLCTRNNGAYTATRTINLAGNQSGSTAFDGINFLVSSGTMSGTYTIYGYSKTV